jgi:hypothetical protein
MLTRACCFVRKCDSAYGAPRPGGFPGFPPHVMPAHVGFAAPHTHMRGPSGHTIKMRGLPFRASQQDVYNFFDGFAVMPETLHIGSDAMGRPSGEGWLAFATPEEAERAARERNRQFIGSRFIELTVV